MARTFRIVEKWFIKSDNPNGYYRTFILQEKRFFGWRDISKHKTYKEAEECSRLLARARLRMSLGKLRKS